MRQQLRQVCARKVSTETALVNNAAFLANASAERPVVELPWRRRLAISSYNGRAGGDSIVELRS